MLPFYSKKWFDLSLCRLILHGFDSRLQGVKTQKLQLCRNPVCNCFALSSKHLDMYLEGDGVPPAPLCLHFPLWEMWTHLCPSLITTTQQVCSFTLILHSHIFYIDSSRLTSPELYYMVLDVRVLPALCGTWIHFWTFPTALQHYRQLWGTYLYLFTRDTVRFDAFKVSTSYTIDIFCSISLLLSLLFYFVSGLILAGFWVTYIPNIGP